MKELCRVLTARKPKADVQVAVICRLKVHGLGTRTGAEAPCDVFDLVGGLTSERDRLRTWDEQEKPACKDSIAHIYEPDVNPET